MRKTTLALLLALFVLALGLPAMAQVLVPDDEPEQAGPAATEDMDMVPEDPGMRMSCQPGCDCPRCMKAGKGMTHQPDCRCDTCGKARVPGKTASGFMGLHGDFDRMTLPPMQRSCRTPEFYLRHAGELGISDEQAASLKKLDLALKKELIMKGAAVKVLELELSDIVTKTDFRLSDAQEKLKQVEKARYDLRSAAIKYSADARDVLGPEQLDKLKDMLASGARAGMAPSGEMKKMMMEKMQKEMMK